MKSQFSEKNNMYGVVPGIVIDLNDPEGLGRVKVKFPVNSQEEIGHWARITTFMSGPEMGAFFFPEKNDEVLIAFEMGDITRPYVIGALWNGKDKTPDKIEGEENNKRFIKTKSGHILRFDDKSGVEKIEIIDKTGKNSITIDTSNNAIKIVSDKDISLEAPQGTVKINAQSIEITAKGQAKVQSAGLDLDGGSGVTNLKGSIVNIN